MMRNLVLILGCSLAAFNWTPPMVAGADVDEPGVVVQSVQITPRRRRLDPTASIVDALNEELANGVTHPHFTLTAKVIDPSGSQNNPFTEPETLQVDVVLANPSVTEKTTTSSDGGPETPVGPSSVDFLVAAATLEDGITPVSDFVILTVYESEGSVAGLVQKANGDIFHFEQLHGAPAVVIKIQPEARQWKCGVVGDHIVDGHRSLEHDHDHDHSHNFSPHDFTGERLISETDGIKSTGHLRRLYATDTYQEAYSYNVDLYLEVDDDLVQKHDGGGDTFNFPKTKDYLNTMITAISSMYEKEVDTHLNVLHIVKTDIYDHCITTENALEVAKDTYAGPTWIYPDGHKPDLHHIIMGKNLGGGQAEDIGVVCNASAWFGVSSAVVSGPPEFGDFSNTGVLYWDIYLIAHELGHQLGSIHTHAFIPVVDKCVAEEGTGNTGKCIVPKKKLKSIKGTVMSYCHQCGYPDSVTMPSTLTLGGFWETGDRNNVNNWKDYPELSPFNYQPKRVPHAIYTHVSSRGECVKPYLPVPEQTPKPTSKPVTSGKTAKAAYGQTAAVGNPV